MFFPPIPPIPSTGATPPALPPSTGETNKNLQLTEPELEVVKNWTTSYSEADKTGRYELLRGKILPLLYLHNKHLSAADWKERKSVSTQ